MVEYPPGEPQDVYAICGGSFEHYDPEFAMRYANLVCGSCDEEATTEPGGRPKTAAERVNPDDEYTIPASAVPSTDIQPEANLSNADLYSSNLSNTDFIGTDPPLLYSLRR